MSCARCEALEEEVAYLKGELGLASDSTDLAKIGQALGLKPSAARVVEALYRARGRVLSRHQLHELSPHADEHGNIVSVYVCYARKALGVGGVINAWGEGYRLSPEAMAKVSAILGRAA